MQVWDTNQQMVACKFEFSDRIFGVGMSPLASSHCLVAVASDDPTVKLCDPTTGGCMHSLVGHRHPVLSVTWALGSEHQLVSAGGDGEVSLGFCEQLPAVSTKLVRLCGTQQPSLCPVTPSVVYTSASLC